MTPDHRPIDGLVTVPIRAGGLMKMSDIRDFVEATDDQPEDDVVWIMADEMRWEKQP